MTKRVAESSDSEEGSVKRESITAGEQSGVNAVTPGALSISSRSSGEVGMISSRRSKRSAKVQSAARAKRQQALVSLRMRKDGGLGALSGSDSDSDSDSSASTEDDLDGDETREKKKAKMTKKRKQRESFRPSLQQAAKQDFLSRFTTDRKIRESDKDNFFIRRDPSVIYESDDMDNFIVDDEDDDDVEEEEEEEEEEGGGEEVKKRIPLGSDEESEGKVGEAQASSDADEEEEGEFEPSIKVGRNNNKKNEGKEKKQKEGKKRGSGSARKRSKVVVLDSDEGEQEEEDEDEEEEEEELSGPALYWQVDAMLDKKQEQLSKARGHAKRHHSRQEAMHLYLEMLARAHLDEDFSLDDAANYKFAGAVKQIEDIICTTRESLLGSGAWNQEYTGHMTTRPFFTLAYREEDRDCVPCAACHRRSIKWMETHGQPPLRTVAYMYGTEYDAQRVWNSSKWAQYMPAAVFMWHTKQRDTAAKRSPRQEKQKKEEKKKQQQLGLETQSSASEGEDEDEDGGDGDDDGREYLDDEDEEELDRAKWWLRKWPQDLIEGKDTKVYLGGACAPRSAMYHNLLHYKFRLLYRVRSKLEAHGGDVDALVKDAGFVKAEVGRFGRMLDLAGKRYGGAEQEHFGIAAGMDIWGDKDRSSLVQDEADAPAASTPAQRKSNTSSSSSSSSSSGGGSGSGSRMISASPSLTAWLVRK